MWISWQAPLLRANPFLQVDSSSPQLSDFAPLRIAPGVDPEEVRFGELGYAREARASHLDFVAAKSRGDLPSTVRFQVSLPTPWAIVGVGRFSRADFQPIFRACERSMLAEQQPCRSVANPNRSQPIADRATRRPPAAR